jgi:hypothetical protein
VLTREGAELARGHDRTAIVRGARPTRVEWRGDDLAIDAEIGPATTFGLRWV